ncbi:uncharacterized protein RMCC_5428 [Mycolicibacterium canariasense]|uniref:Uncharacterized protein n=1 Tax=Mycolicibacterium canariasense TaxID=228230 RepID=A0A124E302_MYCCR|nr:uncharacterized protein RMCC_5428 [Mycolicibacterium canariasense]
MASRTVTSEIAMVPDSEFSEPTLMVEPAVSTQDAAAVVLSLSLALLPHPANTRAAAATTLPAARTDLLAPLARAGRRSRIYCLSVDFAWCEGIGEKSVTRGRVSNRHVRAGKFLWNV